MAFNPFHGFRKHKKVIFAILTIICMFTFVLSGGFGRGDAFEWLLSKIGASSKQGAVVTTLYGDKVYEAQIHERQRLRRLANQFLAMSFVYPEKDNSRTATMNEVRDALLKSLPRDAQPDQLLFREIIGEAFVESNFLGILPQFAHLGVTFQRDQVEKVLDNNPSLRQVQQFLEFQLQAAFRSPEGLAGWMQQRFRSLSERQRQLAKLRASVGKSSPRDRDVIEGVLALRAMEMWHIEQTFLQPSGTGFLFGGTDKRQDILDFMVWQKQADTLGIKLTEEDVRTLLNLLSPFKPPLTGKASVDSLSPALRGGNREQSYDLATLYKALIEEFRVLLAQGIIMGGETGMFAYRPNAFREALGATPGEYLDFYREQRRSSDVVLLPIPVRAFIDAVKQEIQSNPGRAPTEEQLRTIYETYSKFEPVPSSARPGLKIPRRVRVQWIADGPIPKPTFQSAAQVLPLGGFLNSVEDPREQLYLDRALAHYLSKLSKRGIPGLAEVMASGVGATLGRTASGWPTISGVAAALEAVKEYTDEIKSASFDLPTVLKGESSQALATALLQPEVIAAGIGGAAGPPLAAVSGWHKSAQAVSLDRLLEGRKRARVLAGLIGSSTTPLLAVSPWASAEYQGDSGDFKSDKGKLTVDGIVFPAQVPVKVVLPQANQEVERKLVRRLQMEEIGAFQKRFAEAKDNEELARRVLNEFVKEDVPLRNRLVASAVGLSAAGPLSAVGAWQPTTNNLVAPRLGVQYAMGASQNAADNTRYTLSTDPGLRALYAAWIAERRAENEPRKGEGFGFEITSTLSGSGIYESPRDGQGPASIHAGGTTYYYWLTKNEKTDTPRQAEATEAIYQIWLEQEARELARRRAEEIRDQLKGKSVKEAETLLKKLAEENPTWGHLIRLDKVVRQRELDSLQVGAKKSYGPYPVSEHDIAYPASGFVDNLMKLGAGQAGVFHDEPEKHFYVAFVLKAHEAPPLSTALDAKIRDQLLREISSQQRREKQKAIMKQLRLQAGSLDSRGRFELNPNIKKDDEGSQSSSSSDE